jgi:hypothetical protein
MARLLLGGVLLLMCCTAQAEEGVTSAFIRSAASPMLPLDHDRLARKGDSPHLPEQVMLTLAGPGAMAVSWLTNPQARSLYSFAVLVLQSCRSAMLLAMCRTLLLCMPGGSTPPMTGCLESGGVAT